LVAFGVTTENNNTTKFPYPGNAVKYRKGFEKEDRRFWWEPASAAGHPPFLVPGYEAREVMFICEGESDTMALWQAAPPEMRAGIVGLSGLAAWKPGHAALFSKAKIVFCLLDNDDPYGPAKEQNDKAYQQIRSALGSTVKRVVLPQGIKDIAEFFLRYDWEAFRVLLKAAQAVEWNYTSLDLTGPMPSYDWLVKDLICKGDVVRMGGDGGLGKSWLTMDLAVAMLINRPQWLGLDICDFGRVMYIDQENPLVAARNRLRKLGLTEQASANMRFLWQQGIRLDTEADAAKIHDDALAFQPSVIFIDSFSTIHRKDENSAEDVNQIFHGGIVPLARETNATVIVIHHTNKGGGLRGSSALSNAPDLVLGMKHLTDTAGRQTGQQVLLPSKLRNVPSFGSTFIIERKETVEGYVSINRSVTSDVF